MNKLRERFSTLVDCGDNRYTSIVQEQNIDKCEQITDDFSIKFGEYLRYKLYDENLTTTELLQYFKENVYGK
jgi:hypothetical protein